MNESNSIRTRLVLWALLLAAIAAIVAGFLSVVSGASIDTAIDNGGVTFAATAMLLIAIIALGAF
jgi:hypothetical protein